MLLWATKIPQPIPAAFGRRLDFDESCCWRDKQNEPPNVQKEPTVYYTTIQDVISTEREAAGEGWKSRRLLLAEDGLPFSVHETTVAAGSELRFKYRDHSETVYCIEGRGTLADLNCGRELALRPGILYVAQRGDDHILRIEEDTRFLCVFEPALVGQEEAT